MTASPSTPIAEAVRTLVDAHVGALPVMDGEDCVGILTISDVLAHGLSRRRT